jgi:hypothetical protein
VDCVDKLEACVRCYKCKHIVSSQLDSVSRIQLDSVRIDLTNVSLPYLE